MAKVLISDPVAEDGINMLKNNGFNVIVKTGMNHDKLIEEIKDYDVIVVRSATKVTADVINAAKNLKLIVRGGVGIDNIDISEAEKKGIAVFNTPGASTISVAELALGMMLTIARGLHNADKSMKQGNWEKKKFKGLELYNKTLGLIGSGRIGTAVAKRAQCFGMNVIAYDPYVDEKILIDNGITPVKELDELLSQSDFISLHIPKTKETTNLINKDTISKMKNRAILINCARGGIVNEEDLYDALKSGKLYGAGIDVYSEEPPKDSPLRELDNILMTPHIGASTKEGQQRVSIEVAEKIIAFFNK